MSLLASVALAVVPFEPWPLDWVDACEVHTVLADDGQRRFRQTIWLHLGGPNEIVDWRFYDASQLPEAGWCLWLDQGRPRAVRVISPEVRHYRTYEDCEIERRTLQPLMFRQRLLGSED